MELGAENRRAVSGSGRTKVVEERIERWAFGL